MEKYWVKPMEFNEGNLMSKWYVPMTVVGLGGLGVLLFTDRGRKAMRWAMEQAVEAPFRLKEWNEAAQRELDRVQTALNQLAESLESLEAVP